MQSAPWKSIVGVACLIGAIAWSEKIVENNPPPGRVHVTYWEKWTDFEADAMRRVVNDFNHSQNKIYVDMLTVSGIENKTLMATAGRVPPDVAGLYGENVTSYVDNQAIEDLTDYCKQAGIKPEQYIPAFIKIGTYNGHIYALPSAPASVALHYDKQMFIDAGLDPNKPPETIQQLDADSAKIFKKKDGKLVTAGFMASEPGWWNWSWGYFFGGKLWDGKTKITANSPENVRAFTWLADYAKKYGAQSLTTFQSGFGTFSSPQNAFLDRQVAMELQGVWMANFISKFSPSLKWGAVPFPYPEDHPELKGITVADEDVLVIPRDAKHPKEAFEFIKFVESQHGMEELCLGQKKNSPLVNVSPEFYARHPNPFIRLFSDLPKGPHTFSVPQTGIWGEYKNALSEAFSEVTLLKKTPQEALDDVQHEIQPKLDEHLERLRQRGMLR